MTAAGVFQGAPEFDRYEVQVRRTYLHVADGMVFLASMPELPRVSASDIRRAQTCLTATGSLGDVDAALQFTRGDHTIRLLLRLEGRCIRITDPKQDEWGGFGGLYEPVGE